MMQAMPMMMAMPMMGMPMATQARTVAFEQPRSSVTDCCEELEKRMNALDERVDALDKNLQTIQRTLALQTKILEEIKEQGTIGSKPIP
jgi:hypothetical protein